MFSRQSLTPSFGSFFFSNAVVCHNCCFFMLPSYNFCHFNFGICRKKMKKYARKVYASYVLSGNGCDFVSVFVECCTLIFSFFLSLLHITLFILRQFLSYASFLLIGLSFLHTLFYFNLMFIMQSIIFYDFFYVCTPTNRAAYSHICQSIGERIAFFSLNIFIKISWTQRLRRTKSETK